jgi:hypothetical protein
MEKQETKNIVALSSAEVEYRVMAIAWKELALEIYS